MGEGSQEFLNIIDDRCKTNKFFMNPDIKT